MKEKLRQLFGGDQKQDKTKEVAEQKEQKVRKDQDELKLSEAIKFVDVSFDMENGNDGAGDAQWDNSKPHEEKADGDCAYTTKDYAKLKDKLKEVETQIIELERQVYELKLRCRQSDEVAIHIQVNLEDEKVKRKAAEKAARAAQSAVDELEKVKTILDAENAAEAAQGLVEELKRVRGILDSKDEAIASLEARHGNLLRMSKERANADRNLRPKKWHTGYPVIRSTQKKIKNEIVWETLIQTHYHFDLVAEAADEEIQRDLFTEKGLIYNLGITDRYEGPYESMKTEMRRKGKKVDELNVAFTCRLERDFQGKYWKVWVMHTKPLGEIPDDMMLQDN